MEKDNMNFKELFMNMMLDAMIETGEKRALLLKNRVSLEKSMRKLMDKYTEPNFEDEERIETANKLLVETKEKIDKLLDK